MGSAEATAAVDSARHDRPHRVGLLAGWGRFPVIVAEALSRQGCETYCFGIVGHADPRLAQICRGFRWGGLAKLGQAIRYFKQYGVIEATMAGKIYKASLFQPWIWLRHVPDLRTVRAFAPHFLTRRCDCKDDTLLTRVVEVFAEDGIRFGPATDYAPELLVKQGQLTRRGPAPWQWNDIRYGWKAAKEMGRFDIGQSVAVKNQVVLAVEAVEGTDECIRRAGTLCRAGDFTVVKVAKPQQDMRFDVPTVGLGTLENMRQSGGRVLAIEADATIFVDQPEVVRFADEHKMVIVAITAEQLA